MQNLVAASMAYRLYSKLSCRVQIKHREPSVGPQLRWLPLSQWLNNRRGDGQRKRSSIEVRLSRHAVRPHDNTSHSCVYRRLCRFARALYWLVLGRIDHLVAGIVFACSSSSVLGRRARFLPTISDSPMKTDGGSTVTLLAIAERATM